MSTDPTSSKPNTSAGSAYTALGWLITLLVLVAVVMTAVRLLLAPWFLTFEYNTPNFPADPYGFTYEERLKWANLSMEYLVNDAGVEFVGDLRFEDGTPVFNERELEHFVDVKVILGAALNVWRGSLVLLVLLALWAWRGGWMAQYLHGLGRGGWLTTAFVVFIIAFVAISFNVMFVAFHNVFFEPGTWMFNFSDTFIRLFPERFWRDIFIYIGVFSALVGSAIGYLSRRAAR